MAGPIDAIRAIHNAFRKDMEGIDAAALGTARGERASRRRWSDSATSTRYW